MKNPYSKQERFHVGQIKKEQEQTDDYSALQEGEKQAVTSTTWKKEFRKVWCH